MTNDYIVIVFEGSNVFLNNMLLAVPSSVVHVQVDGNAAVDPVICCADSLANIRHNLFQKVRVSSSVNYPFITGRVPDHESVSIQAISSGN